MFFFRYIRTLSTFRGVFIIYDRKEVTYEQNKQPTRVLGLEPRRAVLETAVLPIENDTLNQKIHRIAAMRYQPGQFVYIPVYL